ncbi:class I SAM-dependent methyltransferase [Cellulophaga sp. Ld12]|uniref:class I SAM-dependent methyltransferase n=1 Tax=Cellulophaga sp. Ld12 TaxID=3229535 RepID=UPI003868D567
MKPISTEAKKILSPGNATKYLRDAVPAVRISEFKFLEVNVGYCRAILPLNSFSSNQHGTHQALILGMAGDYTGGVALASILDAEPILGVHEVTANKGMSLWLIKSEMSYLRPSVEDAYIEAHVPKEKHELLIQRYHSGSTILLDIEMSFRTKNDQDVAKGTFRYYCKKKNLLMPSKSNRKADAMFEHIIKTSAKLIARLRFLESKKTNPLFIDQIANEVAGAQGKVIANRFLEILPELQLLVAGRTHHLDLTLIRTSDTIKQIVFVGVGLDYRIERHNGNIQEKLVYSLDLREMLAYRKECSNQIDAISTIEQAQVQISCNFITESISEKLLNNGFDSQKASLFIFEGCSMYFSSKENNKILNEIGDLMRYNKNSLLWMDVIDEKVFDSDNPIVNKFLAGMARLGEPFIYGFNSNNEIIKQSGLCLINKSFANDFFKDENNEIYSLYSYNLFRSSSY